MSSDGVGRDFGVALGRIGLVAKLLQLSAIEAVEEIAPLLHSEMRMYAAPGVAPARLYESREGFLGYFAAARFPIDQITGAAA